MRIVYSISENYALKATKKQGKGILRGSNRKARPVFHFQSSCPNKSCRDCFPWTSLKKFLRVLTDTFKCKCTD